MKKIFISYKRADKDIVMPIVDRINSELGEICWIDLDGIETNSIFETKIVKAIEDSKIFLFMFSQRHKGIAIEDEFDDELNLVRHQDWTIRELNLADNKYKTLVNLDNSSLDICPLIRGRFQSANYTNATDPRQMDNLIDKIGKLLKIDRNTQPQDRSSRHTPTPSANNPSESFQAVEKQSMIPSIVDTERINPMEEEDLKEHVKSLIIKHSGHHDKTITKTRSIENLDVDIDGLLSDLQKEYGVKNFFNPINKFSLVPQVISDITQQILYMNMTKQSMEDGNAIAFDVKGVRFYMMLVRSGQFTMGSDRNINERPVRSINIYKNFYIGETLVTEELWHAVMGDPTQGRQKFPMNGVSWHDCELFIERLSSITNKQFRFLTEEEWEFAARGGHDNQTFLYSGSSVCSDVSQNNTTCPKPIKCCKPNELGLYDMSGNLWEWCSSVYAHSSSVFMPDDRVLRGGCWKSNDNECTVSFRHHASPDCRRDTFGLRLAMNY